MISIRSPDKLKKAFAYPRILTITKSYDFVDI